MSSVTNVEYMLLARIIRFLIFFFVESETSQRLLFLHKISICDFWPSKTRFFLLTTLKNRFRRFLSANLSVLLVWFVFFLRSHHLYFKNMRAHIIFDCLPNLMQINLLVAVRYACMSRGMRQLTLHQRLAATTLATVRTCTTIDKASNTQMRTAKA